MADEDSTNKRKRRIVRNPETFRERATKTSEGGGQPKRRAAVKRVPSKLLRPVFSPVGRGLRRLARIQPFKAIAWVFKWIGRILVPRYLRDSWKELRLVSWPNRKQSRQLTFAVLLFAIVFGALVALLDYGLDKAFKVLLLK